MSLIKRSNRKIVNSFEKKPNSFREQPAFSQNIVRNVTELKSPTFMFSKGSVQCSYYM